MYSCHHTLYAVQDALAHIHTVGCDCPCLCPSASACLELHRVLHTKMVTARWHHMTDRFRILHAKSTQTAFFFSYAFYISISSPNNACLASTAHNISFGLGLGLRAPSFQCRQCTITLSNQFIQAQQTKT